MQKTLPVPKNMKQIQIFLDLVNYYKVYKKLRSHLNTKNKTDEKNTTFFWATSNKKRLRRSELNYVWT